jgi:hypothetical protein
VNCTPCPISRQHKKRDVPDEQQCLWSMSKLIAGQIFGRGRQSSRVQHMLFAH